MGAQSRPLHVAGPKLPDYQAQPVLIHERPGALGNLRGNNVNVGAGAHEQLDLAPCNLACAHNQARPLFEIEIEWQIVHASRRPLAGMSLRGLQIQRP